MKPLGLLAILAVIAAPAIAEDQTPQTYQNLLTPLLQGGTDILGKPLAYPAGNASVTAAVYMGSDAAPNTVKVEAP
jgi:hypothetical protein